MSSDLSFFTRLALRVRLLVASYKSVAVGLLVAVSALAGYAANIAQEHLPDPDGAMPVAGSGVVTTSASPGSGVLLTTPSVPVLDVTEASGVEVVEFDAMDVVADTAPQ